MGETDEGRTRAAGAGIAGLDGAAGAGAGPPEGGARAAGAGGGAEAGVGRSPRNARGGAAPLFRGADFGIPDAVSCPFCEGAETELHAAFGSALSVVTYWCRRCRTAFEWMKQ